MTRTRFWIIGALFIPFAGCAINDKGLVSVRYFENGSCYLLTQESWGVYLSTRQSDGGLTLGHAKRIMIYPKPGTKSGLAIDKLFQQSTEHGFDMEIEVEKVDLKDEQPYAWIEKNQGITFHANQLKIGLSGGIDYRSAIRLPVSFDGIFTFGYRDNGTLEAAVIHEISKN